MRVTAVRGKAAVVVMDWGRAPLAVEFTKRGRAFIPNGFIVETKSDAYYWIAETRVSELGHAEYRFSLKDDPAIQGEWRMNPTAAYKDVNERHGLAKFVSGSNGRLIMGLTYEGLQSEVLRRFDKEIKVMLEKLPKLRPTLSTEEMVHCTPKTPSVQPSGQVRAAEMLSLDTSSQEQTKRMKLESPRNVMTLTPVLNPMLPVGTPIVFQHTVVQQIPIVFPRTTPVKEDLRQQEEEVKSILCSLRMGRDISSGQRMIDQPL